MRPKKHLFAPAVALIAGLCALPAPAAAQASEEQAVIAVVQKLFDGMRTRDTVAMKSVFAPGAQLLGLAQRDGSTAMRALPADQFASSIASAPPGEFIERVYDPVVKIDGNLASYWAFYTFHVGERFSHCGVDAVLLFKFPDGWKIASIADTRRQEGCERQ
jgi:hypothetical protein